MHALKDFGRLVQSIAVTSAGSLAAMAVFGLLLGFTWQIPDHPSQGYKEVTLLLATGLAFIAGGFLSGFIAQRHRIRYGLALGFLFGLCSFVYVLPQRAWALVAALGTGSLGALGGWLAYQIKERNR